MQGTEVRCACEEISDVNVLTNCDVDSIGHKLSREATSVKENADYKGPRLVFGPYAKPPRNDDPPRFYRNQSLISVDTGASRHV